MDHLLVCKDQLVFHKIDHCSVCQKMHGPLTSLLEDVWTISKCDRSCMDHSLVCQMHGP